MRKFSQLNEGKIEVETNSINYLSVGELNKYLDKNESEFYNNVAVDISTKAGSSYTKTFNPKESTLIIIKYLIKHNDSYIKDLGGNGEGNALAIFFRKSAPSDPEKLEVYRAIAVLNTTMRLKEVPTFMTRSEFDDVMQGKCSLDYVVYDMETEKGRNAIAKQYKGLVYNMANKYKNHANLDWGEWLGEAHLGLTYAMNQYVEFKGLIKKKNKKNTNNPEIPDVDFDASTVKYDDALKQEVKTDTKKPEVYAAKFIVFAKWWINFCMLGIQEHSHLVRISKSEQARERAEKGSNTWDNTTSMDKKLGNGDGDGAAKTVGDTIGSTIGSDDELNRADSDRLFGAFYKYLKKHLDKVSVAIFLTHFGLNGLEKIGNKEWSEYITNSKDEDINKLYDAIFDANVTAEKQWIKDYDAGNFVKRTDKVKGAGKPSISTKFTNVIKWIRSDKNASKAMEELYAFESQIQNEKDREHTLNDVFNPNNMVL